MAKLFVSYSRKDSAAARRLIEAFRSMEQDVWVDWESIPPAVDWLEQIFRGIEESDAFIFMISPDSIASEVCKVEINRAAQNNKRIIPIVLRDVQPKDAPESIRKLNWTFIREGDNFEEGVAKVKTAIELDLDWLEEHRRLQVRSLEWHRKKDPSLLLRGRDLRNARHMVATATAKDPIPTELQQKFIQYSSQSERNRTITFFATGFAVIALAILFFFAAAARDEAQVQRDRAVVAQAEEAKQRQIAQTAQAEEEKQKDIALTAQAKEAEQRQIAEENEIQAQAQRSAARAQIYQSRPGELFTSTLLAIDSMRRAPSDEAEEILRRNLLLLPLPVKQFSQAGKINSLAVNNDRSIFVTASADGTVCAWRVQKDVQNSFCTPKEQPPVNAVAFNADGSLIAMGDQSGVVQILDAATGDVLHAYQRVTPQQSTVAFDDLTDDTVPDSSNILGIPVRHVSFHPKLTKQLAIAYADGQIPVVSADTFKVSSPLYTGYGPNVMGFSPDGAWLVVGSDSGIVSVWNLSSKEKLPSFTHRGEVLALAFSPKEKVIATGGNDNTAMINLSIQKQLYRIPNQPVIRGLVFSPDGSRVVTASADRRVRVWNTSNGNQLLTMSQDGSVTEVVYSSDGQWIATTGEDRTARVWDAVTGAQVFQIPLKGNGAQLAFCNDNKWLLSTDESGAIEFWDVTIIETPVKSLSTLSESLVDHAQYSPSGGRLAVSSENNLWQLTSDPEIILKERELTERDSLFDTKIREVVYSPDVTRLGVLTEGNELAIYNLERGTSKVLKAASLIRDIAFTPDSQYLVTSDSEGKVQTWDIANEQWIENPELADIQVFSLATNSEYVAMSSTDKIYFQGADGNGGFSPLETSGQSALLTTSPEGSWLASADSKGRISTWQYQAGKFNAFASFEKERAVSIAIHPTKNLLAIGTTTHVYLLEMDGKELARIPHIDTVSDVSFSADGKYLATASSTRLQVWEIDLLEQIKRDDLIPVACSRLFENLSQAQWATLFPDEDFTPLCEALPEAP